jgi:hypothetical protein
VAQVDAVGLRGRKGLNQRGIRIHQQKCGSLRILASNIWIQDDLSIERVEISSGFWLEMA